MQTRHKVELVKALLQYCWKSTNPTQKSVKDTKRCRLGRGKSWVASWPVKLIKDGKGTQTIFGTTIRHSILPENLRIKALHADNGQQAKCTQSQRSSFSFKKTVTTGSHSVHWWLSHQRPVRVGFHCQTRCDHHPWRQWILYGLSLQPDNRSSRTWPQEATVRPHNYAILDTDSMNLLKKVKPWIWITGWLMSLFDIHPLNFLWIYCPWYTGVKGNNRADRLEGKATITNGVRLGRSDVLRSLIHYLRAESQGRHTIWKRSMIFLESQRKAVGRTMALF